MVWSLSYRPRPDSYPGATIVEGNTGPLELVDDTPDGGTNLRPEYSGFSGRRVKSESVPKAIRFGSKRKLLDYETARMKTVSGRFRDLIEGIEPNIHQFEPVKFVSKDGENLGIRWLWQVCNRLDSVHSELTENYSKSATSWSPTLRGEPKLVFSLDAIGHIKFWNDKYILGELLVSDDARDQIMDESITGVHFRRYAQA
jgi:hypothetical protein